VAAALTVVVGITTIPIAVATGAQHRDDRRRSSRSTGQSPRDNGNRRSPLRTNTMHNSVGSEATKVAAVAGGESQAAVDAHEN